MVLGTPHALLVLTFCALVAVTADVFPLQSAAEPVALAVEKLHDRLFVLRGGPRSNAAVFVTGNGVVLVDARGGWGVPLQRTIRTITERPITTIINTHSHPGHVSGNVEFPSAIPIIAHANAQMHMLAMPIFKESGGRGLPTRTFTERLTLGSGGDEVDLRYFGRGHTNGDIWVIFPAVRVVYVDIFPGREMPLLDEPLGGSGVELVRTLDRAVAFLDGRVDRIVTAHGPTTLTMTDLRDYAEFNRGFAETVRAGKQAGRSATDIAEGWKMPARFSSYAVPTPERIRANVEVVFREVN